jgi:3-hydroxyacyl-[acyl-carrier-protein] dehydratase
MRISSLSPDDYVKIASQFASAKAVLTALEDSQKKAGAALPKKGESREASSDMEKRIAAHVAAHLKLDKIDVSASFFDIGGSSLSAVQFASRLAKDGLNLTLAQMFQVTSLAELAALLDGSAGDAGGTGATAGASAAGPVGVGPKGKMNAIAIMNTIAQRWPMLMVDGVEERGDGYIRAFKMVSINEPQFVGHFPGQPVFPGVLIIESIYQCALIYVNSTTDHIIVFSKIVSAQFLRPVFPGDCLEIFVKIKEGDSGWTIEGECKVRGDVVAKAELGGMSWPKDQVMG